MTSPTLEIDGSCYSGSGSIVRQATAWAAVTGRPIRVRNARARRPHPGLRTQHLHVAMAIRDLVGGTLEGAAVGAQSFEFHPGQLAPSGRYVWDIGTAGSATLLALAVLPIVIVRGDGVEIEIRGGMFQDSAPSLFHLQHVILPLVARMGANAEIEMVRPGYVPTGGGILRLVAPPADLPLAPLVLDHAGPIRTVWGIALSSHLSDRQVSSRMASAARAALAAAGVTASIDERDDLTAAQPGAALTLVADLESGGRLGADRVGAPRRRAEDVGVRAARQLLDDIATGATVDRYTADQILTFAALARGLSTYRLPIVTEHVEAGAWLAGLFLDANVTIDSTSVSVNGCAAKAPRGSGSSMAARVRHAPS